MSARIAGFGSSIFGEITALSRKFNAVNLGQGFPDFDGPEFLKTAVSDAMRDGRNQYAAPHGEQILREAVAAYHKRFYGQEVDANTEITITSGATEALFCASLAFIEPGDEVIVFEPFYDAYVPAILMAGGIPKAVTLHAPDFRFNPDELQAAFSTKTKAIYINTPHNPTGTVFSKEELTLIAELCQEFDVMAICDEVYEHLTYDGVRHTRLCTLPGMFDRCLAISSLGKSFSLTGWKIGWAIGGANLQTALRRVHQFTVFATSTPMQYAAAVALPSSDEYYQEISLDFQKRRDFMMEVLHKSNLTVKSVPKGSYFILAGIDNFQHKNADEFAKFMIEEIGVAVIPPTTFYLNRGRGDKLIRFTYCKKWETLEAAADRMTKL